MADPCGSVGCMELRAAGCCLADAYRCVQNGTRPARSAADVAAVIFSGVCGPDGAPAARRRLSGAELRCIGVSLVEEIASSLAARSLSPAVALCFTEILRVLIHDLDLVPQLVHQFQAQDQIISHLAAKSVSACVFYHLHESGAVSPAWEQKCLQVFHGSSPGAELDACLWSLTDVLKRLLKGAHREILGRLLAAFDSSLCALCSKFLPEDEATRCLTDATRGRRWGTTFCLLLDLLEVLTASGLICGAGVCLRSQRLTHIHTPSLLTVISGSSEYFVRKRALLLLKRAVLQKAGEDWALGEAPLTGLKHEHFDSDMSTLARSVLTAVAANWLQSIEVDSASFFGGSRLIRGDERQKPDCVMLRAVSLLLLKSMELHIQTAGGTGVEVYEYLQSLWGFLKRYSTQLMEVTHPCCWVSLLFGDQDDDMMEAAKALLSVFLHHRRCSGLDDSSAACSSGCNPHCHFLLLLQSISFDHSILLDFLISTETCFLEYFVRYLKYLRTDWRGFGAACGRISVSLQKSLPSSCGGAAFPPKYVVEPDRIDSSSCVRIAGVDAAVETLNLAAGLRLVEYGSSDESEPENMDSQDEPAKQEHFKSSHSAGLQRNSIQENRPEGASLLVFQSEQTSCSNMAAPSGHVTCETSARAVRCLSELREVVTRLQTKKLFPYNPGSLLKLLAQV